MERLTPFNLDRLRRHLLDSIDETYIDGMYVKSKWIESLYVEEAFGKIHVVMGEENPKHFYFKLVLVSAAGPVLKTQGE